MAKTAPHLQYEQHHSNIRGFRHTENVGQLAKNKQKTKKKRIFLKRVESTIKLN